LKRLAWSILLVLPVGASADIYRSVDENGVVVYSDLPTSSAELVAVRTATARTAAAQPTPAAEGSEASSEEAGDDSPVFAEVPREPTPEEIAEDRARNCEYSRQMLESYSTSHRLYRQGADGERQYLSDDEIDAARAKAESNVAAWCD
jgi:hypothetical protein